MKDKLFIVVNEGDVVFASTDPEEADGVKERLINEGIEEEIEDSGRDIDDLTDEEYAEFAFSNGFNGGHHYTAEVEVSRDDLDKEITTDEGDTLTVEDIYAAYDNSNGDTSDIEWDDLEDCDDDYEDEDDDNFEWDDIDD